MLENQKHRCAICDEIPKKTFTIDHCHTTGVVRELLCNSCNVLLGNAKDNISILERAISYLKKHDG